MARPTCPHCGGHRFRIATIQTAEVYFLDDDDFDTELIEGDLCWDNDAAAQCCRCGKTTAMDVLENPPPKATPKPAGRRLSTNASTHTGEKSLLALGVCAAPDWKHADDLLVLCSMGQVDAPDFLVSGATWASKNGITGEVTVYPTIISRG